MNRVQGRRREFAAVAVLVALLAVGAAGGAEGQDQTGPVSLTVAVERQALDLDRLEVVDLEPIPLPDDGVDLQFAYNSQRANPLVAWPNLGAGARLAFLDGQPFDSVVTDPWSLEMTEELLDVPFDPDDTVIVATGEGAFFKVGNAWIDTEGRIQLDVARIE